MAFALLCNDFKTGGALPSQFTCDGKNGSPPLWWNDPPKATVCFVLMLVDTDMPGGNWTHWVLYDLPKLTRRLPSGVPATELLPQLGRARQAKNEVDGKVGYSAPCTSGTHRYAFRLFALDRALGLPATTVAKAADIKRAIQGHVLGTAELLVSVTRK